MMGSGESVEELDRAFPGYQIFVRSSSRKWNRPDTRYFNLGFRVALTK